MQIHSDSGVDPLLTLEGISIFPLFLFLFISLLNPPLSLFPGRFASRIPSARAEKASASRLGECLIFPNLSGQSPRPPNAFHFKTFASVVANHSLFGSKSPNHHSIFGRDKVVGIPISPNLGGTCPHVPNGLVIILSFFSPYLIESEIRIHNNMV